MSAQHRYRKWYATAALLVVLGAAVFTFTRPLRDAGLPSVSVRGTAGVSVGGGAPSGVGPRGEVDGVPVGWQRSLDGARAAGEAYVSLTGAVLTAGPLARADMINTFATPEFAPMLLARTEQVLDDAFGKYTPESVAAFPLRWGEWPLTSIAVADGEDIVAVQVWSVAVASADDSTVPVQVWRTASLHMVWRDGDWKVAAWDNLTGPYPTPMAGQYASPAEDTLAVLGWDAPVGSAR